MTVFRFTFAALVSAMLMPAASLAQDAPTLVRHPVGLAVANGHCTSLTVAGKDMTCGDAVVSIRYDDGRRSFAVTTADGMVSFFGMPDADGIALVQVTGVRSGDTLDKPAAATQAVTGRCTPATMAARTQIACRATAADGAVYAMAFTVGDTPPADRDFPK